MLRITHNLVAVGVVGLLAVSCCAAQTQSVAALLPAFEVASVRPSDPSSTNCFSMSPPGLGQFHVTCAPMSFLIALAFGVNDYQIEGRPDWLGSVIYDISAKTEGDGSLSNDQLKPLLQQLLAQRFKLMVHHEMKDFSYMRW